MSAKRTTRASRQVANVPARQSGSALSELVESFVALHSARLLDKLLDEPPLRRTAPPRFAVSHADHVALIAALRRSVTVRKRLMRPLPPITVPK